jgi:hypothetical protein
MKVEIKKVNVKGLSNEFNAAFYPSSGIFKNELGNIIFVNKNNNLVSFVCSAFEMESIQETEIGPETETKPEGINEKFVLELTKILTREKDH